MTRLVKAVLSLALSGALLGLAVLALGRAELDDARLRAWKARVRADGNAEALAAITVAEDARRAEEKFGAQGVLFTGAAGS